MADTDPPIPDPAILDNNVQALYRVDPGLADRIRAVSADDVSQATPATARDGRPTFRLLAADGSTAWFGRTSIPNVRAEALLEQFKSGQANVLLSGIGEGSEAAILTRRMARHRAVFIWEPNSLNILLMLRLHDVAQAIAEERLVFINCEASRLSDTLVQWLEHHPGHLCPDRILLWPWYDASTIAPCRTAIEAAFREIEQRRRPALQATRQRLESLPALTGSSSVVILAIHPFEETLAMADSLVRGATQLGWSTSTAVIRLPGDVHPLARSRRLAASTESRPSFALMLDVCRHEVRDVLPVHVPAITWVSPLMAVDASLPKRLGDADMVAAADATTARQLSDLGIDRGRMTVCPLPCLAEPQEGEAPAHRNIEVLLVGSLRPLHSASFGLELPTHIQVWEAAIEILRERAETFTDDQIDQILTRAETRTGVRIADPDTRRNLLSNLVGPAGRVVVWHALAQAIANKGFMVHACGHGWGDVAGVQAISPGAGLARRAEIYGQTRLVIQADPAGGVGIDPLLAAGHGAVVLWRGHPRDNEPGGLGTLLTPGDESLVFRRFSQVLRSICGLLGDESERSRIAANAVRRCREDHSPAARLTTLQAVATSLFTKSAV